MEEISTEEQWMLALQLFHFTEYIKKYIAQGPFHSQQDLHS